MVKICQLFFFTLGLLIMFSITIVIAQEGTEKDYSFNGTLKK